MTLPQQYMLADIERYAAGHEACSRVLALAGGKDEDEKLANRKACEAEWDKAVLLRRAAEIIREDAREQT